MARRARERRQALSALHRRPGSARCAGIHAGREEARVLRVQPVAQVEPPHADQRQAAVGAGQGHADLREPDTLQAGACGLIAGV